MPDFTSWRPGMSITNAADRAVMTWWMIQNNSISLVLYRAGVEQSAQTVRLEFDNTTVQDTGEAGMTTRRDVTIFGVKDHPTVSDTDIESGDQFAIGTDRFEVDDVLSLPGEIQARARRLQ